MKQAKVEEQLNVALGLLYTQDAYLLNVGANERAITHRLGMYLQDEFPDWHVDCEYNRDGHEPKRVTLAECEFDRESYVCPDIIIHKRGCKGPNLLVIEVKANLEMHEEGTQHDQRKLAAYKKEFNYEYAVFLRVWTGVNRRDPVIHWC